MGWLTGWSFRRPVIVNNANNPDLLTDYQVLVVVHTASLIQQRKMRADCNDIRFTDSDGTTLLPYWIEGPINAANTKIWVKVPQIPANGTKVIYLYYGNPTVQSESSIANTFIREIDGAQPVRLALPMDEGSGSTVYDQSGNNNNGTIYGAIWTTGRFGNALRFDGVDDYVLHSSAEPNPTPAVSVEAWVFPTIVDGRFRWVVDKSTDNRNLAYLLGISANNQFRFITRNLGGDIYGPTANPNQWYHLVGVDDGTNIYLYVNTIVTSRTVTGNVVTNTVPVLIGARRYSGILQFFGGIIDEVRVYNRALSAQEIADLYNNYGYVTPNYPGRVLVRKRTDPEPTTTVGSEEVGYATRRRLLIMSM